GLLDPGLASRLGLDLADRLFERKALARHVRFAQRRRDAAQLRDERRARSLVERAAGVAGVPFQAGNSAGNERVVVGHIPRLHLTCGEPATSFRTGYALESCPRAPGWSRAMRPNIPPIPRYGAHT